MTRIAICLVFTSLLCGCGRKSPSTNQIQTESEQKEVDLAALIGKTVDEAREQLRLKLEDARVEDEPPGIGRAMVFTADEDDQDQDEVWLYVSREDAVPSIPGQENIDEFKQHKLAGIAIRHERKWKTVGDVIPYYHINAR